MSPRHFHFAPRADRAVAAPTGGCGVAEVLPVFHFRRFRMGQPAPLALTDFLGILAPLQQSVRRGPYASEQSIIVHPEIQKLRPAFANFGCRLIARRICLYRLLSI